MTQPETRPQEAGNEVEKVGQPAFTLAQAMDHSVQVGNATEAPGSPASVTLNS